MAIKVDFSKMEIRPPSWSGGKSRCKNCSRTTYWWKSACTHCGHGETKGKYVRAKYLKRVGLFDLKKDL